MKILGRPDTATIGGVMLAAAGLVLGLRLEGIKLYEIGHVTAALIVFCGTGGAILMSMPLAQVRSALKRIPAMFRNPGQSDAEVINSVVEYARAARLRGAVSLEKEVELIEDTFFRKAMRLVVDAVSPEVITTVLDAEIAGLKAQAESAAVVYETGAGYAPTLGMAGAAIGLVQVMKHLERIDQVGMGVGAAFVATIYGVLLANLVLLPVATKIRARTETRVRVCSLIRDGVLSIAEGLNPVLIRLKLEALAQIDEAQRRSMATPRAMTAQVR
jgi:chemotaxis protein MotA